VPVVVAGAMDDARALLESLMGPDRNARPTERRVRKFTDEDICKSYLLGLCPHDLFKKTKMDLGMCENDHNEQLKDEFEIDADAERYRRKWRKPLTNHLRRLLLDVDRLIGKNQSRITREREGSLGPAESSKLTALREEASEKLKQAERAADDGNFEQSRNIMKDSESTKRRIEELECGKAFERYKKDNICEVCGLIVDAEEIEAMKSGRGWHINGKQHLGFQAIREKLKELEDEHAKDKRNGIPSPTPSPVKVVPRAAAVNNSVKDTSSSNKESSRRRSPRARSSPPAKGKRRSRSRRSRSHRSRSRRSRARAKGSRTPPRRSRSRGRRTASRRSRSRRKASTSRDRKPTKAASPRRRSLSRDRKRTDVAAKGDDTDDRGKALKAKNVTEPSKRSPDLTPPKDEPKPPPKPPHDEPPPPPPQELKETAKPPPVDDSSESEYESAEPPTPKPDIDVVRPKVAFFYGAQARSKIAVYP